MTTKTTDRVFAETDDFFRECCIEAKVDPTKRQAAKYRRQRGAAWTERFRVVQKRKEEHRK